MKAIGMIHVNTDGGIAAANEIDSYLEANYGMKLVTRDQLSTEDTDFTAQVLNLKSADADCVIFWGLSQAQGQVCFTQIKQLYRDDILFAGGTNLAQAQMLDAWDEKDIQGIVFPVGYIPSDDPAIVRFQQYFKEADAQHQDAADVPARVFDAVYHIATALNDMGEQDVNSPDFNRNLAVALRQASFDGIQGHFDFSQFDNGVGLGIMNVGMWGEDYTQTKVYP